MKNRLRKGFTLIEIIIVIVIIGVMATLALPRITGQLEASKAAEAVQMFGTMRRAAQNCFDIANSTTNTDCNTWGEIGMTAPTSAKFTYQVDTTTAGTLAFRAVNINDANQAICMSVNTTTMEPTYTYLGTVYAGIMKRIDTNAASGCTAAAGFAAIAN